MARTRAAFAATPALRKAVRTNKDTLAVMGARIQMDRTNLCRYMNLKARFDEFVAARLDALGVTLGLAPGAAVKFVGARSPRRAK